jgi:Holliday junction resolvase RusA-like endonuclease
LDRISTKAAHPKAKQMITRKQHDELVSRQKATVAHAKSKVRDIQSTQTRSKVESVIKITEGVIKLPIEPMGAVRLSSSDRWSKRPVAKKYFDWKNRFKTLIHNSFELQALIARIEESGKIEIETVHPLPKTWSNKKKRLHYCRPMRAKPDFDNVAKAVCDVLFKEDKRIHTATISQRWCGEFEQPTIIINS